MFKYIQAIFILIVFSATVQANLITNGSFEDTSSGIVSYTGGSQWTVYSNIDGWFTIAGTGLEVQTNIVIDSLDGNNHVELDSHSGPVTNSTIGQWLNDLSIGQTYNLQFAYAPRTGSINNNTNGINVLWGETETSVTRALSIDDQFRTNNSNDWDIYSLSLVATDSTMLLGFQADGREDTYGGLIDDVSMTSVPEPSVIALFSVGLIGLGFARRKVRI